MHGVTSGRGALAQREETRISASATTDAGIACASTTSRTGDSGARTGPSAAIKMAKAQKAKSPVQEPPWFPIRGRTSIRGPINSLVRESHYGGDGVGSSARDYSAAPNPGIRTVALSEPRSHASPYGTHIPRPWRIERARTANSEASAD